MQPASALSHSGNSPSVGRHREEAQGADQFHRDVAATRPRLKPREGLQCRWRMRLMCVRTLVPAVAIQCISEGLKSMASTMVHVRVDEKTKQKAAKTLAGM